MKLLLSAAAVAALTVGVTAAQGQSGPTTFHLVQAPGHLGFVDNPPKHGLRPPSPGDVFVISAKATGDVTATTHLVCTVTSAAGSECHGSLGMGRSSLTFEGFSTFAGESDSYAITGGTGQYAGAVGTMVTKHAKGDREDITVTLG